VSKDLRKSTVKLMRQLQDNPDVSGNQRLIRTYKTELTADVETLMEEMYENQTFQQFG
jgi:hypothetical protein